MKSLTYKHAGVDIDAGDALVERIKKLSKRINNDARFIGGIGGFGGAFSIGTGYKNPVLVSGTDGVGTKLKLAFAINEHSTIGIDLVAMCVNDIITCGAKPLFFLDYFATGKLSLTQGEAIISGIVEGCRQSSCVLLGGETAEMPGLYAKGEYDLAGFAVGIAEQSKILNGKTITPGDIVFGIPSSGLHSNGYSLARKIFSSPHDLKQYGKTLLTPTRIYVPEIMKLIEKKLIKGCAHITGGGLVGNIPRVLPKQCGVVLHRSLWNTPDIFSIMQKKGHIAAQEMYRVFNMGIGMVLIASGNNVSAIEKIAPDVRVIGEVVNGAQYMKIS